MNENRVNLAQKLPPVTSRIARLYGEWFEPTDPKSVEKAIAGWAQRPMEMHLYVLAHLSYLNLIQLQTLIEKTDQLLLTGLDVSQQTRTELVEALNGLKTLLEEGMNEPSLDAARLQLPTGSDDVGPVPGDRSMLSLESGPSDSVSGDSGSGDSGSSGAASQLDAFLRGLSLPVSNHDDPDSPDADPSAHTETAYGGEDVDALMDALSLTMDEGADDDGGNDGDRSGLETGDGESSDVVSGASLTAADVSQSGGNR